jgi:hypothetical protein
MGTAETVLGKVLNGRRDCRIVTKLGSMREPKGWVKTWLRAAKRIVQGERRRATKDFSPVRAAPTSHGCWDPDFLRDSVERSLAALGRIDAIYMHDPPLHVVNGENMALIEHLARHVGATPGIAFSAIWPPSGLAVPLPDGWEAQGAYDPNELLARPGHEVFPPLTLHSLIMTGHWLARQNQGFDRGLAKAAQIAGNDAAAIFAVAHARMPATRLILATASTKRLTAILKACAAIDASRLTEIEGCFEQQSLLIQPLEK